MVKDQTYGGREKIMFVWLKNNNIKGRNSYFHHKRLCQSCVAWHHCINKRHRCSLKAVSRSLVWRSKFPRNQSLSKKGNILTTFIEGESWVERRWL